MIDITPYQKKLTLLQDWIHDRIDGKLSPPIWVDMEAMPMKYTIKQLVDIYRQSGLIFYTEKDVYDNPAIPISFEEYCKYWE